MKKRIISKLLLALITVSLLLSGCGAKETDGSAESSQVEREQESTEQVEKEIEDASFTWNVSDKDLYLLMRRQLEVKPNWFLGTATYADGTTGSIEADRIELGRDGLILLVDVYYDGDESVRYQIEVPEMWEDMNLNEQSQEDIEAWYEGLGGDGSAIDSSATEIHDDWNVDVADASDWEFIDQVKGMIELRDIWKSSLSEESQTDYNNARQAYIIIGNEDACDPDYVKEYKEYPLEGKDYYLNVSYESGSEWQLRYGDASITEVFKEAGVADYGVPCVCYCTYSEDKYAFEQAVSDYFNMGYSRSSKDMNWLAHAISKIPLSEHNVRQLSMEEVREYILAVYMYYGDEISVHTEDGLKYYEEPHILKLYGFDGNSISQKFGKYFVSGEPTLKSIYKVYEMVVEEYGYSGSIFDFYSLDSSKLDSMMLQVMIDGAEADNWVIDEDIANIIKSLGGEVSESATIIVDSESETTESKPEVTLNEEDIPPLNDPIR